jgi:predicted RNase H-like HicB family nuclease
VNNPYVRVELLDATNTWVVVVPVRGTQYESAVAAASEALGMFITSLVRDSEAVERNLCIFRDIQLKHEERKK